MSAPLATDVRTRRSPPAASVLLISRLVASGMVGSFCLALGCGSTHAIDDAGAGLDGGRPHAMDAGIDSDAAGDADLSEASEDAATAADAARLDATPALDASPPRQLTCDSCETDEDCTSGHICGFLLAGVRGCLPACEVSFGCPPEFALCEAGQCTPAGFCCADADGDGFGRGELCPNAENECDDSDPDVHWGVPEICNGRDDNCNGNVDEAPNTCTSGTCADLADRSEATSPGTCGDGTCSAPAPTGCGAYRCARNVCATSCLDPFVPDLNRDDLCIPAAHCDAGECLLDFADGEACDEDSDCASAFCTGACETGAGTCACEPRSGS